LFISLVIFKKDYGSNIFRNFIDIVIHHGVNCIFNIINY
jgi:hypothetical protein